MTKQRPVFLNLTQIKFPPMAIASILHRLSGVVIFLSLPFLLWALHLSLTSPENYQTLQTCLTHSLTKFSVWLLMSAVFYHILAGLRHIIMDFGYAESLCVARAAAYLVIGLAVISSIFVGVWLW